MYRKRFDENKLDPDKFRTLSDLQYIPPTTKDDMRDNYPFGLFAGTTKKRSYGFTLLRAPQGKPTVVGYTKKDLDTWSELMARIISAAGVTDEDIAQICFGYGLFTGALGLHYGLERIGASVVPSSSGNSEKQIMLMKDFGTTTLIATPTYAMYLGELAHELGYDLADFKLRIGLFGSEDAPRRCAAR